MTDMTPKRKPGRPAQYTQMVRLQAMIPAELRDWLQGLPGDSTNERLAWLRRQIEQADAGTRREMRQAFVVSRAEFYASNGDLTGARFQEDDR